MHGFCFFTISQILNISTEFKKVLLKVSAYLYPVYYVSIFLLLDGHYLFQLNFDIAFLITEYIIAIMYFLIALSNFMSAMLKLRTAVVLVYLFVYGLFVCVLLHNLTFIIQLSSYFFGAYDPCSMFVYVRLLTEVVVEVEVEAAQFLNLQYYIFTC